MSDADISEVLGNVKRFYIDKYLQLSMQQSNLVNNMDEPEVVMGFTIANDVNDKKKYVDPQPVVAPIIQRLKDALNKMRLDAIP